MNKIIKSFLISSLSIIIAGCGAKTKNPNDPMEGMNRGIYSFNKTVDSLYIKPVAKTYELVVPTPMRGSVGNFIQTVNEIPTGINDILQGKPHKAGKAAARLVVNATLGIFGIFDIASDMGIERHTENLSNTLLAWGYKDSAYFVIPFLGPSTIRDTIGLTGNIFITPTYYAKVRWRNVYVGTYYLNTRVDLFPVTDVIEAASAVDEYAFVRNAYLQNRAIIAANQKTSDKEVSVVGVSFTNKNQSGNINDKLNEKSSGSGSSSSSNNVLDEPPE